jgi:hypothetical protein
MNESPLFVSASSTSMSMPASVRCESVMRVAEVCVTLFQINVPPAGGGGVCVPVRARYG